MNLSMKWLSEFVDLRPYVPQRVRRSDDHEPAPRSRAGKSKAKN